MRGKKALTTKRKAKETWLAPGDVPTVVWSRKRRIPELRENTLAGIAWYRGKNLQAAPGKEGGSDLRDINRIQRVHEGGDCVRRLKPKAIRGDTGAGWERGRGITPGPTNALAA